LQKTDKLTLLGQEYEPMRQINLIQASLMTGVFLAASVAVRAQGANAEVDAIFADLTKPGSPGCALGVYHNRKIIYAKGYGLANIEENVPITPKTVFDIGSLSKQFTAAAILCYSKNRADYDLMTTSASTFLSCRIIPKAAKGSPFSIC
jgi:beta-lactamase family protein